MSGEGWWEGKGRSDDAQNAVLYVCYHASPSPPLCANVAGVGASGSVAFVIDVVLRAQKCV